MEKEAVVVRKERKSKSYKIGMVLLILALLTWIIPVVAPFTPFSTNTKTIVVAGAIIIAEVMFWVGAILVGKEVAAKFKGYLNPKNWRKIKREGENHRK
ncbi:transporter suffix domain-containing protein [Peribacillus sp. NPDC097675]|uniref:transporter suffix domain-containing protein n=1 Tax=Peribacillus sp. NPDC097675 TaxID=3390618 RepID=UPI003D06867E